MLSEDEEVKGVRQKPIHMFKNYAEICSQAVEVDKKVYRDMGFSKVISEDKYIVLIYSQSIKAHLKTL
jgi:hypothetical protein